MEKNSEEKKIMGYTEFLEVYNRIAATIDPKNRTEAGNSSVFMSQVSMCYSYVKSLSPYEKQYLSDCIPGIDDKINVVVDLHSKIRSAIVDAFKEIAEKK